MASSRNIEDDRAETKIVKSRKANILWGKVVLFAYIHVAALYGFWVTLTSAKLATIIFNVVVYELSLIGVTAGAHRLWAHTTYKAKFPLKLLLVFLNTVAFQNSVIDWSRDHRVHHKFVDTDADPSDSRRGFFYSHIGWVVCRKDPAVYEKAAKLNFSDLWSEPMLRYQKKYYLYMVPFVAFMLPSIIPFYLWGEPLQNAYHVNMFRYCLCLNCVFLLNSAAHMWGYKPYDKNVSATQIGAAAFMTGGEGWHNYHHVFPQDYKCSEFGKYSFNTTTAFLHAFAKIGWAYDLKAVSPEVIAKRMERLGDGTVDDS